MMRRWHMAALTALLLAACAQTGPAPGDAPPAPAPGGACQSAAAQFAVGRPYTAELAEQARQRSGAAIVRALRPGQVVTMEFNARRLTLRLDAVGRVQQATCG